MIGNNKKYSILANKSGFSLVEVLVSVSLFIIIILSSTQIFKLVIDGQRSALATQNVQESLKYFLEVTAKEMRMAKKNSNLLCSGIAVDKIFATSSNAYGDVITFQNYDNECVTYSLALDDENQRFKIQRDSASGFISPSKIRIDALNFILSDATSTQPMITFNLRAWALNEAQFKSDMTIQTSITSRYYK